MVAKKILGARSLSNREKTGLLEKHPRIPRARQCELLDLKRSSSYYERRTSAKDGMERDILFALRKLKRENPRLGLRRCVPLLRERYGLETTHDKLRRMVKQAEERKREKVKRMAEATECKLDDEHLDDYIRELLRTTKQKPIPRNFKQDDF